MSGQQGRCSQRGSGRTTPATCAVVALLLLSCAAIVSADTPTWIDPSVNVTRNIGDSVTFTCECQRGGPSTYPCHYYLDGDKIHLDDVFLTQDDYKETLMATIPVKASLSRLDCGIPGQLLSIWIFGKEVPEPTTSQLPTEQTSSIPPSTTHDPAVDTKPTPEKKQDLTKSVLPGAIVGALVAIAVLVVIGVIVLKYRGITRCTRRDVESMGEEQPTTEGEQPKGNDGNGVETGSPQPVRQPNGYEFAELVTEQPKPAKQDDDEDPHNESTTVDNESQLETSASPLYIPP